MLVTDTNNELEVSMVIVLIQASNIGDRGGVCGGGGGAGGEGCMSLYGNSKKILLHEIDKYIIMWLYKILPWELH